jgi:membrane protein YqaA with SNARE-associated domain
MTDSVQPAPRGGPLRRLYAWMMANAQGRHAWAGLAAFAFAEASFFPIPADVMLVPMVLANRRRAFALAAWCTLFSVLGGALGYTIGALFWDTAGLWIIHALHIPLEKVEALRQEYSAHAYMIMVQGLTPIPYKLVTISAGLASVPFAQFMLFSAITRGVRYNLVAALFYFFGPSVQALIEKYMALALTAFLALVVLGFVAVRYLF